MRKSENAATEMFLGEEFCNSSKDIWKEPESKVYPKGEKASDQDNKIPDIDILVL